MTTVSAAGRPVAGSSNLTVTVITGCPGDSRRLRATAGCGGLSSTLTAAAGSSPRTTSNDEGSGSSATSGPGSPFSSPAVSCRYAVDTAAGSPAADHTHRTARIGAPAARPRAQATSCGASRRDTCRVWQVIAVPIGSSRVPSPPAPSTGIQ
jgi:hypothetical protein